jgi:hypothetical protein
MTKIIVDEVLTNKIEALQYEVESRKDIIVQVLAGVIAIKGDQFKNYQEEYKQFYIDYNKAKQEMLDKYNIPNNATWNLSFATRELTME